MNDKENAFSWLKRGLATGALGVFYKDEPVWDPIRDDPRFAVLVGKMVAGNSAQNSEGRQLLLRAEAAQRLQGRGRVCGRRLAVSPS